MECWSVGGGLRSRVKRTRCGPREDQSGALMRYTPNMKHAVNLMPMIAGWKTGAVLCAVMMGMAWGALPAGAQPARGASAERWETFSQAYVGKSDLTPVPAPSRGHRASGRARQKPPIEGRSSATGNPFRRMGRSIHGFVSRIF